MFGLAIALGWCFVCRKPFAFDVERVPGVLIDPATGLAPDTARVGDQLVKVTPSPEALERAFPHPICPQCARVCNAARRAAGSTEFLTEEDTAAAYIARH